MKKIITIAFASGLFTLAANAQNVPAPAKEQAPMSKEDKEKMKVKQEAELVAAFKEAGLTDEQQKQVREAMEASKQKNNLIKKDDALKAEEKEAKLKASNDEKNEQLKTIMGADKYKLFNAARKKQKEQDAAGDAKSN